MRLTLSTISKICIFQILVALFVTLGFLVFGSEQQALSPALGGVAAVVPNLYFAFRIYLAKGKDAKKIMRSFYAGESGKVILTAALFALIFQIPTINLLTLLVGYIAVLSVFWFALLLWRDV